MKFAKIIVLNAPRGSDREQPMVASGMTAREGDRAASVNLRSFKKFVGQNFGSKTALYRIAMSENDEIPLGEFLIKCGTWWDLIEISVLNPEVQSERAS